MIRHRRGEAGNIDGGAVPPGNLRGNDSVNDRVTDSIGDRIMRQTCRIGTAAIKNNVSGRTRRNTPGEIDLTH